MVGEIELFGVIEILFCCSASRSVPAPGKLRAGRKSSDRDCRGRPCGLDAHQIRAASPLHRDRDAARLLRRAGRKIDVHQHVGGNANRISLRNMPAG